MSDPIPAQIAADLAMPLHRVVVDGDWLTARFECDAPEGSKCRLTCSVNCGAEEWPCGAWDDEDNPIEQHPMSDSGECHVVLFLAEDDLSRDEAGHTGAIRVTWEGDYYSWTYADRPSSDDPAALAASSAGNEHERPNHD